MTRDPSDGSVREKPVIETGTSGLQTDKLKADEIARLQRSREWLTKYRTNPEAVTRQMGDQNDTGEA